MALSRTFAFGGDRRLELRAEAFNLLNRRNYTIVNRLVNTATFGQITRQADPRQMQFGLRFTF